MEGTGPELEESFVEGVNSGCLLKLVVRLKELTLLKKNQSLQYVSLNVVVAVSDCSITVLLAPLLLRSQEQEAGNTATEALECLLIPLVAVQKRELVEVGEVVARADFYCSFEFFKSLLVPLHLRVEESSTKVQT